jgi:predicted XRE-type DNA-binding protein
MDYMDMINTESMRKSVFNCCGNNADKEKIYKHKLFAILCRLLDELELTQVETAKILGTHQPNLSKILGGQLRLVSSDKLIAWITTLGADVQTKVIFYPRKRLGITVELCEDPADALHDHY